MSRRKRRADVATEVPLGRPGHDGSSKNPIRTLYEIAAERQAQLDPQSKPFSNQPDVTKEVNFVKIASNGKVEETTVEGGMDGEAAELAPLSPLLDTMLLASSLSALHFTLEVLTVHQYAQELHFPPIVRNTLFVAFPTLTLAVHLFHGHLLSVPSHRLSSRVRDGLRMMEQIFFLVAANVAGCYLIHLTNDRGYYAVMKTAPSIGTVWVWCVLELGLAGALAGVLGPGFYAWYNGYGIF